MLPGQIEANGAALSAKHGGLIFTEAEVKALSEIAHEAGVKFDTAAFKTVDL
jgi:L-2-hydroxycarboxylate dehydrogenase (NAD+)